jgi:hypothetical protein
MAFSLTKTSGSVIDPLVFEISECEGGKSTIEKHQGIIRFENNFKVYSSFVHVQARKSDSGNVSCCSSSNFGSA